MSQVMLTAHGCGVGPIALGWTSLNRRADAKWLAVNRRRHRGLRKAR